MRWADPPLALGNGQATRKERYGVRRPVSWWDLRLLFDSCGRPELLRRDPDEALEVLGELALVREAGARGDLRQRDVAAALQELLRPFDAAGEDVLVRRHPGGRLELPREVIGAEMGRRPFTPSNSRSSVHKGTRALRTEEHPSLSRPGTTVGPWLCLRQFLS